MSRASVASACLIAFVLAAGAHATRLRAQGGATATIRGRVHVTGPSPANPVIRMGRDPLCARLNPERPRQEFVVRGPQGELANVFAALDGTFPDTPVPTTPVVVRQQDCVYHPRVAGVRVGQTLRIVNSDTLLHNVQSESRTGNDFNETQPHSDMVFDYVPRHEEQMMRIRCEVHSWMTAYLAVLPHPYFAVTGEDGTFTIANVPAGQQTIHVWQERFGRLSKTVQVMPGQTVDVDFDYSGQERQQADALPALVVPMMMAHATP